MPWQYEQSTGRMLRPNGTVLYTGYAGYDWGRNLPVLQAVPFMGPIPRGTYRMTEFLDSLRGRGSNVIRLMPEPGTDTFGRDGFLIHGDNATNDASQGCIIVGGANNRRAIWDSADRILEVVE